MIFFALAFVFGAFCLQQMPVLPGLYWALLLVPFALIHFRLQYANQPALALLKRPLLLKALRIVFGFLSGLLLGFFWAATFATVRLGDALPHAWENKPVEIIGVVASVSELTERGERFRFDVEKVLTDGAVIPQHISLSFYPPDSWGETQSLQIQRFTQ
ncbi:MAG: DUF4131 domain-containing protein, partial [Candidatus Paceibacterota bacterium]